MKKQILIVAFTAALVVALALVAPSPAAADVSFGTYSHSDPAVTCEVDFNASNQVVSRSISIESPLITTPRSQELASYQVLVYRWNGSTWAYDNQLAPLGGMASVLGGSMPDNSGFTVNTPGYYRIAVKYRWYWNGSLERYQFAWAGTHTQFFTKSVNATTNMWYGNTGSYCYIR